MLPIVSAMFWAFCFISSNRAGSLPLMASAIFLVASVPSPKVPYRDTMLPCSASVLLYIRSISLTDSESPKASCICIFSAASIVSPNLLCNRSRISGILFSWLFASRNSNPNASPPLAALLRNALYFVPASDPDIVACSMPRIDNCSSRGTCALVADAPRVCIAAAISLPLVLNCLTDSDMPELNISANSMSDISL